MTTIRLIRLICLSTDRSCRAVLRSCRTLALSSLVIALSPAGTAEAWQSWRVAEATASPSWLSFGATHRARFAHLWNQYRAGLDGNDMALSLRSTLWAALRLTPLVIAAELADSRVYLSDDNTPVNTSIVNPFELLEGTVGVELRDLFSAGAIGSVRAGRLTIDLGSRRLVARNRFRNTINAFNGLHLRWTSARTDSVCLFAVMPIQRRPTDRDELADNTVELDRENIDALFWGAFYSSRPWPGRIQTEGYVFGLHERDSDDVPSRNRQLLTPGIRLARPPQRGSLDFELEAVIQAGTSRASSRPDDATDLRHLAFFVHAAVGYTLPIPWAPRLLLQYDYASGDANPDDDDNGRFDTLFGARRFELGPTGIYGAVARSNLSAPALRLLAKPHAAVDFMVAYRAVWLARRRDTWSTAGVGDPTGDAGSFVGNQLEARLRWQILPGNVGLDVGFVHLWLGRFVLDAPNGNDAGDPTYIYAQLTLEV